MAPHQRMDLSGHHASGSPTIWGRNSSEPALLFREDEDPSLVGWGLAAPLAALVKKSPYSSSPAAHVEGPAVPHHLLQVQVDLRHQDAVPGPGQRRVPRPVRQGQHGRPVKVSQSPCGQARRPRS